MTTDVDLDLARDFALALFIGVLVGVEREKDQRRGGERGIGGIRTFTLIALVGAVSAHLSQQVGTPWIFVAALVAVSAGVLVGYVSQLRRQPTAVGLTTEVSAIATCLLAGGVMYGARDVSLALGIATTAVLAFKKPIHELVGRIESQDIYAGLKLLIATFIVLPLLPDRPVDPWEALNPYRLWLLVILIAGLSLLGYVAVRWLGERRGLLLTGLFGGLASSTAVTLGFARRSREPGEGGRTVNLLACGILASWAVMFARVLVEVAVVHAALLPPLLAPMLALAAASALVMLALARPGPAAQDAAAEGRQQGEELGLRNPFSLISAGKFAAFFALVLLAVAGAQRYFPERGIYPLAVLAGLTDVDAITLSLANLAKDGGDAHVSVVGIVLATLSNTAVKTGLVLALGAPALRVRVALAGLALLAAGAGALVLL